MTTKLDVHFKHAVCLFRPNYLTLARGSKVLSAVPQNTEHGEQLFIYTHTVDTRIKDDVTRMRGVELANDDDNWEVWEIRAYRAGMKTNLPDNAQFLGTVTMREGKCFNHVYAINLGSPKSIRV